MADTLFSRRIAQLKRQVFLRTLWHWLLIAVLLFLGLLAVATILEKAGSLQLQRSPSWYGGLALTALIGAGLYLLNVRERFSDRLIAIDKRLHLHDRLSTAYEYQRETHSSELVQLLIQDAGQTLDSLPPSQLFPSQCSRLYLMIGGLLLFNLVLFFATGTMPPVEQQPPIEQDAAEEISDALKNYVAQKTRDKDRPQDADREKFYQQMQSIARQLDEKPLSRQELAQAFSQMLNEVQGEQAELTEELGEQIDPEQTDEVEAEPMPRPQPQQLSDEMMQKMRQMLDEMFENQAPESIQDSLDNLEENQDLENFLSKMLNDYELQEQDEPEGDDDEGEQALAQADEHPDADESGEQHQTPDAPAQRGEGENQTDQEGQSDQDESGQSETDARPDGDVNDDQGSFQAGKEKSDGETHDPYQLESSQGPTKQDKTRSSPKSDYNVTIRSVTSIGKSELPEEDVTRRYQQELESVLQKEEIPLNYREYIKNYFISIGLTQNQQ